MSINHVQNTSRTLVDYLRSAPKKPSNGYALATVLLESQPEQIHQYEFTTSLLSLRSEFY